MEMNDKRVRVEEGISEVRWLLVVYELGDLMSDGVRWFVVLFSDDVVVEVFGDWFDVFFCCLLFECDLVSGDWKVLELLSWLEVDEMFVVIVEVVGLECCLLLVDILVGWFRGLLELSWLVMVVVMVFVVVLVVVVFIMIDWCESFYFGVKGIVGCLQTAVVACIELMVLVLSCDGDILCRVVDGVCLVFDIRFLLRFVIDKSGFVRLVRVDVGLVEVIFLLWGECCFVLGEYDMLVKGEL